MPEKALKKLNTYILPAWKACFFVALAVGLTAYFYKITNWLPNWDSLVFRYDAQNMIALGRWFLPVVCSFSSFYDLPFLNGLLAILFHALGAVCICRMFRVERKMTAGLIGAVVVSFPTVTSIMMYNYVADGYSIAFFLSALAGVLLTKEKPNYLISAVLLALATGIYQAYITVTVVLTLLWLIHQILFHRMPFGTVLKKAFAILFSGILGVLLYSFMMKILLSAFSMELLEYQGVSSSASLADMNILASLYVAQQTFLDCFFDLSKGLNVYVTLNVVVLIFCLVFYINSMVQNKIYKSPTNTLMVILLCAMLLLGAGALAFVNPAVDYHNLMRMSYVVFYLCFLLIYERGAEKNEKCTAAKRWIVLVTACLLISNQIVIANVSYHKAQIAYEKSYGILMRIADRIEQTPDTDTCDKILVIGALTDSEDYSVNLTPDITGITDGYILRADDETVGQSVVCSALNDYCGKDYAFVSGKEKIMLMQNETVKSMQSWPGKNCVAVVDGIVVLKLGTEGESK